MKFTYTEEDQLRATVTAAVAYGSICWEDVAGAGEFDADRATVCVDETVAEIRNVVTAELAKLLDRDGVADEWNSAIEQALQVVEAMR